jgi:hypothetical protein
MTADVVIKVDVKDNKKEEIKKPTEQEQQQQKDQSVKLDNSFNWPFPSVSFFFLPLSPNALQPKFNKEEENNSKYVPQQYRLKQKKILKDFTFSLNCNSYDDFLPDYNRLKDIAKNTQTACITDSYPTNPQHWQAHINLLEGLQKLAEATLELINQKNELEHKHKQPTTTTTTTTTSTIDAFEV